MRRLAFGPMTLVVQTPAWAHHMPLNADIVCTSDAGGPGVALLFFIAIAAIGIVRAVARHRKDR